MPAPVPLTPTQESTEIACQSCGAILNVAANIRSTTCPYCASPSIITRPSAPDRPTPTFLVGFVVNHERATTAVRQWLSRSHLFARSDFKSAVPELTHGIYLPAYLYGAVAHSAYSASIGENYTETETYTTTDSKGKTVRRTRTVTKTEWRPLSGRHASYIVDVIVTASNGVTNEALQAIEPFDLRALRAYSDAYLAGWLAEEPSRTEAACFDFARQETLAQIGGKLPNFMPGDKHRNLQHQTTLTDEVIDLVLLPIWVYAIRYANDQPPIQILVNGQTSRVAGKVPISTTKVAFAVIGVLVVIGVVFLIFAMARQ
ncbi:hypothetical protein [Neorhodopirellula pilleata]|uniref:Primosomal protein N' (Replication factor Y)-superfamily II helicase n=1 Tax=Neorhodopirellula pilleata TaxID=2714738 RepID=A0A5C5ZX76_9BACT|nr:hypothetical protein [Neorhodopirellula pilleata]TWT91849.1 hypothetical protein Pla100_48870 [Neorhodopirellula pilleata]